MFYNALMPYGRGAVRKYLWAASGAEYSWNTEVPDAEAGFTVEHRYYDHGARPVTEYQKRSLIPRTLRRPWGPSDEAFSSLLTNNVSFFYLSDPEDMVGYAHRERMLNAYSYYEEQLQAVKHARKKINELVSRIDADEAEGVYDKPHKESAAYAQATNLYWTTNATALQSHLQWQRHRARRLWNGGAGGKHSGRSSSCSKTYHPCVSGGTA